MTRDRPRGSGPAPASRGRCRVWAFGRTSTGSRTSAGSAGYVLNDERGRAARGGGRPAARGRASCARLTDEAPPLAVDRADRREALEPHGRARDSRSSRASAAARSPTRRSRPTRRPAPTAWPSCSIPADRRYPLPVHQLHELRAAVHDRPRRPLRPAADDDGAVRDVRRLPAEYEDPADRRFHAAAQRLPGLRTGADGARPLRPRRRPSRDPIAPSAARPCARADRRRQGHRRLPSRLRRRRRARRRARCAAASTARTSRSP